MSAECEECGYDLPFMADCAYCELKRELAEARAERDHARAYGVFWHDQALGYRNAGDALRDKLAAAEQERDELRKLIEAGHSRGAEISPLIRRIFSAGSRAAADRAALQAKLAAAEERERGLRADWEMYLSEPHDVFVRLREALALTLRYLDEEWHGEIIRHAKAAPPPPGPAAQ